MEFTKENNTVGDNLLIVGNGFDLHCGLRTTYNDFFKHELKNFSLFKEVSEAVYKNRLGILLRQPDFVDSCKKQQLTVWDVFFLMSSKGEAIDTWDWCNIEKQIQKTITLDGDDSYWTSVYFYQDTHLSDFLKQYIGKNNYSRAELYSFLLSQLGMFESRFLKYIRKQQNTHKSYQTKMQKTLEQLDGLIKNVNQCPEESDLYIRNFNYTSFKFDADFLKKWRKPIVVNIHGSGQTNAAIFGIDEFSVPIDALAYIFTKIYRRIFYIHKRDPIQMPTTYKKIIFYGHSLNEQDYSYFYKLFKDNAQHATFAFYYNLHGKTKKEQEENKLKEHKAIAFLLAKVEEKENCANLQRTLLDSGRLLIKELK